MGTHGFHNERNNTRKGEEHMASGDLSLGLSPQAWGGGGLFWNYLVSLLRKRVCHSNDDTRAGLFILHHVDAGHPLEWRRKQLWSRDNSCDSLKDLCPEMGAGEGRGAGGQVTGSEENPLEKGSSYWPLPLTGRFDLSQSTPAQPIPPPNSSSSSSSTLTSESQTLNFQRTPAPTRVHKLFL